MALSDVDNTALVKAGEKFVCFFVTHALQSFFYGIHVLLTIVSIIVHYRKESMSRAALITFLVTIGMFVTTTIYYASATTSMVLELKAVMVEQSLSDVNSRLRFFHEKKIPYNIIKNWMISINLVVSDALVVWRAWALSEASRKRVIPSLALLFLTFLSCCIFAGYSCVIGNLATSPMSRTTVWQADQMAMGAFSLLTNISATVVIAWKAWEYRTLAPVSPKWCTINYGAEHILALVVESGVVYCLVQAPLLVLMSLSPLDSKDSLAASKIQSAGNLYLATFLNLSPIYPTSLILLVAMQRSISESQMWRSTAQQARVVYSEHAPN